MKQRISKGIDFGAGVGEVIQGQLARGEGGKFINAADLGAVKQRLMMLVLLRLKESAGVSDSLLTARKEKQSLMNRIKARLKRQGEKPKKEPKEKKPPRSSRSARAAGAKKPKKSGKKKSETRKETQAEKQAKKEAEQAQNRAAVAKRLEARGITAEDLEALVNFRGGGVLTKAAQAKLAKNGLIEIDAEGYPRMTAAGSALVRAANKGDKQKALDSLSKAREKIDKKQSKVEENIQRIDDLKDKNEQLENEIADLENEINDLSTQLAATDDPAEQAKIQSRIDKAQKKIDSRESRIRRNDERIKKLTEDNQKALDSLGTGLLSKAINFLKSFFIEKQTGVSVANDLEVAIEDVWDDFIRDIEDGAPPAEAVDVLESEMRDALTGYIPQAYTAGREAVDGEEDGGVLSDVMTGLALGYLAKFMLQLSLRLSSTPLSERVAVALSYQSRGTMYAGEAWKTYIKAKVQDADPDGIWQWSQNLDNNSCATCIEEVNAGPRPLKEITRLPGVDTICLSSCRHDLERVK